MGCAVWSFPTQHVRVPVAPHPRPTWYVSRFDVSQSRGCKEGAFRSFNLRFLRNKNIEHFSQTRWPFASFFFFFFLRSVRSSLLLSGKNSSFVFYYNL